jgi:2-keto-4-pentenoate hydratase/2-oxohepta-3-ene-1,7-dioic acid hydratase in catechol pathway
MRVQFVNYEGRAGLLRDGRVVDVERVSGGRFGPDPMAVLRDWAAFDAWARALPPDAAGTPLDEARLGPPVPRPAKVFAIALNYRDHAAEAGLEIPAQPLVFTKFPSCLVGPRADVVVASSRVDWEVELVVAIGAGGRDIPLARALEHVAGYCVGQDVSDRRMQFAGKPPQFSMGKSLDTFGPLGPVLVPVADLPSADDLEIACTVSGERMQASRTSQMIFGVPALIEFLSRALTLAPGDLIFTGTPAGVGSTREPRRHLAPGDVIESTIEGLGTMVNRCVAGAA